MKVLQLCHKSPYPAKDGGCLAILNISQGLINAGIDLKILTIETKKHPFIKSRIPKDFLTKTQIESVFVDTSLNLVDAFSSLITQDSYNFLQTLILNCKKNSLKMNMMLFIWKVYSWLRTSARLERILMQE